MGSLISGDFFKEIYGDIAKPSVQSAGKALGAVCELIFGGLTYFLQKGNIYIKNNLEQYRKKLENVPADNIIQVDPQIGVPIVEKLKYTTHEEISELFTTLLANASNSEKVESVHPAFISIIEQLAPDEARIINYLKGNYFITYCDINGYLDEREYWTIMSHVTKLPWIVDLNIKDNINTYLDNLVRLGLLKDNNCSSYRINNSDYDEILKLVKFEEMKAKYVPAYKSLKVEKGDYEVTELGKMFIKACIAD